MAKQRVNLETRFEARSLSGLAWLASEQRERQLIVAVHQQRGDERAARGALWRVDARTGESVQLSAGQRSDGSPARDGWPRVSPDGQSIAFISDRSGQDQIWLIQLGDGEARQLTSEATGCGPLLIDEFYFNMNWSPDGSKLVFVAPTKHEDSGPARVWSQRYEGECYASLRGRLQLWELTIGDGRAKQLTHSDHHHGDPHYSPDGRSVVLVSNRSGHEEAVQYSLNRNFDLWRMPAGGGKLEQLTTNPGPDFSPRFSPDGTWLAFLGGERAGSHADVVNLRVLNLRTGEHRVLTSKLDRSIERLSTQCFTSDSRWIFCAAGVGTGNPLLRVRVKDGHVQRVSGPRTCASGPAISQRGDVAWLTSGRMQLTEIAVQLVGATSKPRLTRFNQWLRDYELGERRVIRWRSEDHAIEGVLTLPPGYREGKRHPLLLHLHGGPHSRASEALDLDMQLLASWGFVVLEPNFRGSAGYGQAFIDADRADMGGGDFRDCMAGVDQLIEQGMVDPEQLAIMGGSYGGYLTCWSVTQTHRFKAAVVRNPVTNLWSMFGSSDIPSWTTWEYRGYPWEPGVLEQLIARSPVTHAHQVRTPTLLVIGLDDLRVAPTQAREFHTVLRLRGVKSELVAYAEANHALSPRPEVMRDYWGRVGAWLAQALKRGRKRA